jgi:hypothetical protein
MRMAFMIEVFFAYMILIPFIVFNIFILFGSFFQARVSKLLQKILKPEKEIKKTLYKTFKFLNVCIWIVIGILFFLSLDNPFSLAGIMVFIAFRSGASLIRRLIFGIHDIRIMKHHLPDNKAMDLVSLMVKFGIFVELLFILIWGILYQYLGVAVNSIFGIEVNFLTLFLWIAGFGYGLIASIVQSIFSKQFLLKNEIGIALVFSGQILREKVEEKKRSVKKLFKF